jgi:hypothetical protein
LKNIQLKDAMIGSNVQYSGTPRNVSLGDFSTVTE